MGTLITRRTRPKEGSSFDGMTLNGHGDEDDVSCRPDILEDIHNHSIGLGETSSRNARRYPYKSMLHWDHLQQTYRYLRTHSLQLSISREKPLYIDIPILESGAMESLGRLLGVRVPYCHDALSRPITQAT